MDPSSSPRILQLFQVSNSLPSHMTHTTPNQTSQLEPKQQINHHWGIATCCHFTRTMIFLSHLRAYQRSQEASKGSHSQLAFSPLPPHLYHSHQRLRGIHIKACICFKSFVYPYPSSWNSLLLCIDKLSINPIFKLSALIILFPAVQTNKRIDGFLASYSLAHHSNITILEFLLAWMLNACLALPDAHLQMLIRGLHSERQQWCSKIHCMFHSDTHLQVLFHIHLHVLI